MRDFKNKVMAQQYKTVTLNGVEFKVKKMDELDFKKLAAKVVRGESDFEIELVIGSIKAFKGIKGKDIADPDSLEDFTKEELEADLPFDVEYLKIYFGKPENQESLVELYSLIGEAFAKFLENKNKKKAISNTELKE